MIFFSTIFFLIGLCGICVIWLFLGFIYVAMNHERIDNAMFPCLWKLTAMGPMFIIFYFYGHYLKHQKRSIRF